MIGPTNSVGKTTYFLDMARKPFGGAVQQRIALFSRAVARGGLLAQPVSAIMRQQKLFPMPHSHRWCQRRRQRGPEWYHHILDSPRAARGAHASEAIITKEIGHRVANLIAAEGKELEKWLSESGIAKEDDQTGSKRLDLDNLRAVFTNHCAVMTGHLPCSCWPPLHRKVKEPFPTVARTCVEFLMHGQCEHVIYVKALGNNTFAAKLEKCP